MIYFSLHKRFLTLLLGVILFANPLLHADEPSTSLAQPKTQDWGDALNATFNAGLIVAPTIFKTSYYANKLFAHKQKHQIGDKAVKPELQQKIKDIMHEQGIQDTDKLEIVAMKDALYQMSLSPYTALPTPEFTQMQSTFKHNVFGVHVTNACLFIDEDIINFEKQPLLSTFLIRKALGDYKNNTYRNTVLAKIAVEVANTATFYKTMPLVNEGMKKLTNTIGWSAFGDAQKNGFLLNTARLVLNNIAYSLTVQPIFNKISSSMLAWYNQSMHQAIDETIIHRDDILPLIVEIAMAKQYKVNPLLEHIEGQLAGERQEAFACMYIDELCLLANKLFTTASIIEWFNVEIQKQQNLHDAFMVGFLEHLKTNFFEKNRND